MSDTSTNDEIPETLNALGAMREAEAARSVGLSAQTLVAYRKQKRGPSFVQVGRGYFYLPEQLAQWIRDGGNKATRTLPYAKRHRVKRA